MIQDRDKREEQSKLERDGFGDESNRRQGDSSIDKQTQALMERSTLLIGSVWCLIGGFAMPVTRFLSTFMVAYGSTLLLRSRDSRRLPITLMLVIMPALLRTQTLLLNRELLLSSLISAALSIAVGYMMARSIYSLNKELLSVAIVCLLMVGVDAILSSIDGRALGESILQLYDETARQLSSQNIALNLEMQALRDRIELMWPMIYVLNAFFSVLIAHLGAQFASYKLGLKDNRIKIEMFGLPLWTLLVPIAALVCLGVATSQLTSWSDQLYFVGINLFNALRIPLSFQALGLVLSIAREKELSKLAIAGVAFAGIILELSLYALSVVGLIDLWADFRGLRQVKENAS